MTIEHVEADGSVSTQCEKCGGKGWRAERNRLLGPGIYEVNCDTCGGHGWCQHEPESRP